jgi:hypothetical protein
MWLEGTKLSTVIGMGTPSQAAGDVKILWSELHAIIVARAEPAVPCAPIKVSSEVAGAGLPWAAASHADRATVASKLAQWEISISASAVSTLPIDGNIKAATNNAINMILVFIFLLPHVNIAINN